MSRAVKQKRTLAWVKCSFSHWSKHNYHAYLVWFSSTNEKQSSGQLTPNNYYFLSCKQLKDLLYEGTCLYLGSVKLKCLQIYFRCLSTLFNWNKKVCTKKAHIKSDMFIFLGKENLFNCFNIFLKFLIIGMYYL